METDSSESIQQNIQSTETLKEQKPVLNQKGNFILIVGLVFILIVGVVLGGYYFLNTKKNTAGLTQNDTTKPQAIPTQSSIVQSIPNSVNKIAFITEGEVWVVKEDGTEKKRLLKHDPVALKNPNLTPAQNKTITDKFNKQYFANLSWSRDGKYIAVTGLSEWLKEDVQKTKFEDDYYIQIWPPTQGDIYIVEVESGETIKIEDNKGTSVEEVQFSYDNRQIVYTNGASEIMMADIDSNNPNRKILTNYEFQGKGSRDLVWLPERGEIFFIGQISFNINKPEPSLVKFNYLQNKRDEKPVKYTPGYRLDNFRILDNGKIMYISTGLGPEYKTKYEEFEIRTSNLDGTNSQILYSGKDCSLEGANNNSIAKSTGCNYSSISPKGDYGIRGYPDPIVVFKIDSPGDVVLELPLNTGNWNKNGNELAFLDKGAVTIVNLESGNKRRILQGVNPTEIKWAY